VRILILRALKLGDFLTAVPAYRAVRKAFPHARIALAAPSVFAPLVALLDGAIDELVDAGELEALPERCDGPDIGIDLHGRGPASHAVVLATRPRRFIGFRHASVPESIGCAEFEAKEHEVERWCRLLAHAGFEPDPTSLDLPAPARSAPPFVRGATLIHPGAASEARCWPVERWIEVATAEIDAGRHVVVTGGAGDVERVRAVANALGLAPERVFADRTDLGELATLVAAAGRVVCGDTGVAHLATAYRRPSVLLFGPTPPDQWGPPARPQHRVIWAGTVGDPHGRVVDPGLRSISVESVVTALNALPAL
jgi:ADP-heptose:LPS heptosyltransferase